MIFLLLFFLPGTISIAQPAKFSINIDTTYSFESDDFTLGLLYHVATDHQNRMYLFDWQQKAVYRMNQNGEFQKRIIRRGRGPGEILSMYGVHVDPERKRIYISDYYNNRYMVTDLDGEEINMQLFKNSDTNPAMAIYSLNDSTLVFQYDIASYQQLRRDQSVDSLIHFHDRNTLKRRFSIANRNSFSKLIGYYNEGAAFINEGQISKLNFPDEETLLISPYIYNGALLVYKKGDDQQWSYTYSIPGRKWESDPFIPVDFDDFRANRSKYLENGHNYYSSNSFDDEAAGIIVLRSTGLFKLNSGILVNFVVREKVIENKFHHQLYAELYSQELEYMGSEMIYEANKEELLIDISWKDHQDYFYMIKQPNSRPSELIKFSLNLN